MDELKEYLVLAIAAASLVDEKSGIILVTPEKIHARAHEIKWNVEKVLEQLEGLEALYD